MSTTKSTRSSRTLMIAALLVLVVGGGAAALAYVLRSYKVVYIENAQVEAPLVELSPNAAGTLQSVFVHEGDIIAPNTVVAQVGTELVKSIAGGLVVTVTNNIGKPITAHTAVVTTIDPQELHVIGQVQEDKGLVDIHVNDPVTFTVDAFGSKKFVGIVESVAPRARAGDVVFSVSDKREEHDFNVKVRYDVTAHPELKQGMSAKMWVYKQ